MSKDIKIIKHEENEITLQEVSRYKTFYSRYGKYIALLLVLSLLFIGSAVILTLKTSDEYVLDTPGVDIIFPDGDDVIIDDEKPSIEDKPSANEKPSIEDKSSANEKPSSGTTPNNPSDNNVIKDPEHLFDEFFNIPDEVCFKIKSLLLPDKEIVYYSDYTVKITYKNGDIVRVLPADNNYSISDKGSIKSTAKESNRVGVLPLNNNFINNSSIARVLSVNDNYPVDEQGNIKSNAKKSNIKIVKTEKTNHGTVRYYSDHSAEVEENNLDIWVGKKENIKEYYITDNKISYSNDIKEYNNYSVTYYHDGTVFINSEDEKYFVRNKDDVVITENGYLFHHDNAASVIKSKILDNGFIVDYLSDGGAIIEGPDGNISVRKSNSIIIEDNKLIKVKINNEIKETSKKDNCDKGVIYYNNGSAIVKQDDKVIGYVSENSDIKYSTCISEDDIIPVVSTSTPNDDTTVNVFEDDTVFVDYGDDNNVDNGKSNVMDDKNKVVIENGVVVLINADVQKINVSRIKISNNTANKVKIRIVLENSDKTTLQNYYFKDLKYKMSIDNLTKNLNNKPWQDKNNEYILYDTELISKEEVDYQLGIWLDYTNVGNDAMDKYFYGTIKVYSWEQK